MLRLCYKLEIDDSSSAVFCQNVNYIRSTYSRANFTNVSRKNPINKIDETACHHERQPSQEAGCNKDFIVFRDSIIASENGKDFSSDVQDTLDHLYTQ